MVSTIEAPPASSCSSATTWCWSTDVDEIVAPLPEWGTLGEYLDHFDEELVNCLGYEILHMRDREAPLRPDRPILDQRGYWFPNDAYNKPALATEPMSWAPGFHRRADGECNLDPDLRLIHLHRMDYEICLARHRALRAAAPGTRDDLAAGLGAPQPDHRGGGVRALVLRGQLGSQRGARDRPRADPRDLARAVLSGMLRFAERLLFPAAPKARPTQWQRVVLNDAVDDHIASLGPRAAQRRRDQRRHARRPSPGSSYVSLDYPEFDLCAPLAEQRRFDVVICEQVLEHVDDPVAAVANLRGSACRAGR